MIFWWFVLLFRSPNTTTSKISTISFGHVSFGERKKFPNDPWLDNAMIQYVIFFTLFVCFERLKSIEMVSKNVISIERWTEFFENAIKKKNAQPNKKMPTKTRMRLCCSGYNFISSTAVESLICWPNTRCDDSTRCSFNIPNYQYYYLNQQTVFIVCSFYWSFYC